MDGEPVENAAESAALSSLIDFLRRSSRYANTSREDLLSLKLLSMWQYSLTHVPASIGLLVNLRELGLSDNSLELLPDSIGELTSLVKLDLEKNRLKSLPGSIGRLTRLEHLNVRANQLRELPTSVVQLRRLDTLDARENPLEWSPHVWCPPASARDVRLEVHLPRDVQLEGSKQSRGRRGGGGGGDRVVAVEYPADFDELSVAQRKIVIVGNGEVGKTHVSRLLRGVANRRFGFSLSALPWFGIQSTHGVSVEKAGNMLLVDTGGQKEYRLSHQFFLSGTRRSIALLCLDLSKGIDEGAEGVLRENNVLYWLNAVQARCPGARVLCIGTHEDVRGVTPSLIRDVSSQLRRDFMVFRTARAASHPDDDDERDRLIHLELTESVSPECVWPIDARNAQPGVNEPNELRAIRTRLEHLCQTLTSASGRDSLRVDFWMGLVYRWLVERRKVTPLVSMSDMMRFNPEWVRLVALPWLLERGEVVFDEEVMNSVGAADTTIEGFVIVRPAFMGDVCRCVFAPAERLRSNVRDWQRVTRAEFESLFRDVLAESVQLDEAARESSSTVSNGRSLAPMVDTIDWLVNLLVSFDLVLPRSWLAPFSGDEPSQEWAVPGSELMECDERLCLPVRVGAEVLERRYALPFVSPGMWGALCVRVVRMLRRHPQHAARTRIRLGREQLLVRVGNDDVLVQLDASDGSTNPDGVRDQEIDPSVPSRTLSVSVLVDSCGAAWRNVVATVDRELRQLLRNRFHVAHPDALQVECRMPDNRGRPQVIDIGALEDHRDVSKTLGGFAAQDVLPELYDPTCAFAVPISAPLRSVTAVQQAEQSNENSSDGAAATATSTLASAGTDSVSLVRLDLCASDGQCSRTEVNVERASRAHQRRRAARRLAWEFALLSRVSHPNVIRPLRLRVESGSPVALESEPFDVGTLESFLVNQRPIKPHVAAALLGDVAAALHHLHSGGVRDDRASLSVTHNSLSCTTIALQQQGGANGRLVAKLIDFSHALVSSTKNWRAARVDEEAFARVFDRVWKTLGYAREFISLRLVVQDELQSGSSVHFDTIEEALRVFVRGDGSSEASGGTKDSEAKRLASFSASGASFGYSRSFFLSKGFTGASSAADTTMGVSPSSSSSSSTVAQPTLPSS